MLCFVGCSHILWVVSDYFIHVLNISFKIWAGQPTKSDFVLILKCFELEIILKVIKSHGLQNDTSVTTPRFKV